MEGAGSGSGTLLSCTIGSLVTMGAAPASFLSSGFISGAGAAAAAAPRAVLAAIGCGGAARPEITGSGAGLLMTLGIDSSTARSAASVSGVGSFSTSSPA